ncbi:MAG TPA: tripartite tricarboxylate transporter substrate binding protein [Burkholderiales bacterium]|jgi:tripartite-type tricarboxylate transporter receptor subunit TctC|nr:tripartite tricarboxylate transporter substrate binding protein [Burkholderiales bacterium]
MIRRILAVALLIAAAAAAHAQPYPSKPIKFVIPYSAGTSTDVLGRLFSQKLSDALGQTVIPENKAGAGGNIAGEAVARSAPDGYTLTFSTSAVHATNQALYGNLPFDPIKDFTHITFLVSAPNMLAVNATVPAKNMAELIAYAKANPGKLTFISAGSGTSPHMSGELLKSLAGIQMTHVPYKSITQGFADLMAGQVSMTFYHVPVIYPYVKDGRLRALGVATRTRSALAPEVPPIADTVPGFDLKPWWGLSGPAGMPAEVVDRIYNATTGILKDPDMRQRLAGLGFDLTPMTVKEFNEFVGTELVKWTKLVKDSGAKVN